MISPCRHTCIHNYSVAEMRELLLEYGATDTVKLRQDFRRSQAVVDNEPAWLKNFHEDTRVSY